MSGAGHPALSLAVSAMKPRSSPTRKPRRHTPTKKDFPTMRSMRLLALLGVPAQLAFGQTPTAATRGSELTLDQAIQTAQQNNPTLAQIRNNLRNADAQVRQTRGA